MADIISFCLLFSLLWAHCSLAANDDDPLNLSFYAKGAAIGDSWVQRNKLQPLPKADRDARNSYTAGIGAGNELNYGCSRYDGSYANLVASQLGVDKDVFDFTYTACSGAVIKQISEQARKLSPGQEFILMSAVSLVDLCGLSVADLASLREETMRTRWVF